MGERKEVAMSKRISKILVIEDSRSLLMLYRTALQQAGYRVLGFTKSLEALQAMEMESVDLVLTDLMIPDMNGMDLIPHLSLHTHLPIVVVTGYGEYRETLPKEEPAIKAFFEKPVEMRKLIRAIEDILGKEITSTRK